MNEGLAKSRSFFINSSNKVSKILFEAEFFE